MSDQTAASNTPPTSFIQKSFDEFTNKTTTKHISRLRYETGGKTPVSFVFQLWQFKTKDRESLLFDCWVTKRSGEFLDQFRASKGKMILNCDQENFELKYQESKTEQTEKKTEEGTIYSYTEYGFYGLEPHQLKQICDAKILKMRISGKDLRAEPGEKFCGDFQKHCRQFYNNVYASSLYSESLVVASPKTEEKSKSGCFVATACYGNYDHPVVVELRHFRDNCLATSIAGRASVRLYYEWSPAFARFVAKSRILKTLARILIVAPAVMIARAAKQNLKS